MVDSKGHPNLPKASGQDLRREISLQLHSIFTYYCSFGDSRNSSRLTSSKFVKLCKDAQLIHKSGQEECSLLSQKDVDLAFVRTKILKKDLSDGRVLTFTGFLTALALLCSAIVEISGKETRNCYPKEIRKHRTVLLDHTDSSLKKTKKTIVDLLFQDNLIGDAAREVVFVYLFPRAPAPSSMAANVAIKEPSTSRGSSDMEVPSIIAHPQIIQLLQESSELLQGTFASAQESAEPQPRVSFLLTSIWN